VTRAARATLRAALAAAGIEPCADSACMFGSPGGMSTNHGCHCLERAGLDVSPEARAYIRRLAHACRALAEGAVAKPAAVEDVGIGAAPGSKPRDMTPLRLHPDDIAAIVDRLAHVLSPRERS
jgi:hypothetical protein